MAFHNVPPNGFPDIPDIEDLEAVEKDVKTLKTTTSEQGAAITALGTNKAQKTDIASVFSAESNYAVGDLVYYEGALYECTTAHEAAAWSAEDFTAASVGSALSGVNSNLSGKQNATDNNLTTTSKTVVGAINELDSDFSGLDTRLSGIYSRTFYNDTASTTLTNVYLPTNDKHTIVIIAGNDICTLSVSSSAIVEQSNVNNHITVALNESNQFVISGCPYYSRPMFIATYNFRQQPT